MGGTRKFSGSVLDQNGDFWILGGSGGYNDASDSTEIYNYQSAVRGFGRWRKGFPLPTELRDTGLESQCSVKINSTHIFMAGGYARGFNYKDTVINSQDEEGKLCFAYLYV